MHVPAGPEKASQIITDLIPPEQWSVYATYVTEMTRRGLPYAVGGGLAISAYSACVRNTKDMDLFILEKDSQAAIDLSRELGFEEYTAVPYDRTWSYRCSRDGYIIDFLWKMLNGKAFVDEDWVNLGWDLQIRGVPLRFLPVEELILAKLYILRIDRADWPDILSLLYARGEELDWERLLEKLGDDRLVLGALVNLLRWMSPGRTSRFPDFIWSPLGLLPPSSSGPELDHDRVALFNCQHLFGDVP